MRSPNIHRVELIEERDRIQTQFEIYRHQMQVERKFLCVLLLVALVVIAVLCILLGWKNV